MFLGLLLGGGRTGYSVSTCSDRVFCSGYGYRNFVDINDVRNSVPEGYILRLVIYVKGPHDGAVLLSSHADIDHDVYEIGKLCLKFIFNFSTSNLF